MGDLNQLSIDINNLYTPSDQPTQLTTLKNNLDAVSTNLQALNQTQESALARQNDVKHLVDTENQRLNNKKMTVDEAVETQNRIIYFNDNSRKRYTAYLHILICIAIVLAIVYFLIVFKNTFSFFPDWLFIILMIATVGVGLIIVYLIYYNIQRHDLYNFDELRFNAPVTQPPDTTNMYDSSGNTGAICMNGNCCSDTTIWNQVTGKCDSSGNQIMTNIDASLSSTSTSPAGLSQTITSTSLPPSITGMSNNANPDLNILQAFTTMTTEGFNNYEYIDYSPYK
jgi:hypothetical protein